MKRLITILSTIAILLSFPIVYGGENNSNQETVQQRLFFPEEIAEIAACSIDPQNEIETPEIEEEMDIEELISQTCDKYGIQDDIPLAISKLETGHYKSDAYLYLNNPGGMTSAEGIIAYGSIEEGVEAFVKNLAENYFEQGLTTPETIGPKYCPPNTETWINVVNQLM